MVLWATLNPHDGHFWESPVARNCSVISSFNADSFSAQFFPGGGRTAQQRAWWSWRRPWHIQVWIIPSTNWQTSLVLVDVSAMVWHCNSLTSSYSSFVAGVGIEQPLSKRQQHHQNCEEWGWVPDWPWWKTLQEESEEEQQQQVKEQEKQKESKRSRRSRTRLTATGSSWQSIDGPHRSRDKARIFLSKKSECIYHLLIICRSIDWQVIPKHLEKS